MAADALAPFVTRSSAAMLLTVYNMDILIKIKSKFQQPTMF